MLNEVVIDIETIGDIKDFDSLKLTVVSIYQYEFDKYTSFTENELGNLWPILEKTERIIGYNSEHFDLPILNRYYAGNLLGFSNLDILKVIKESTGTRYKLNDVAKATLQTEKSADGLLAQEWWNNGEKDKVKAYCEQDVRITKELYEYGKKNKMLYFQTLTGELRPFAVDFDKALISSAVHVAQRNINLTLPI